MLSSGHNLGRKARHPTSLARVIVVVHLLDRDFNSRSGGGTPLRSCSRGGKNPLRCGVNLGMRRAHKSVGRPSAISAQRVVRTSGVARFLPGSSSSSQRSLLALWKCLLSGRALKSSKFSDYLGEGSCYFRVKTDWTNYAFSQVRSCVPNFISFVRKNCVMDRARTPICGKHSFRHWPDLSEAWPHCHWLTLVPRLGRSYALRTSVYLVPICVPLSSSEKNIHV